MGIDGTWTGAGGIAAGVCGSGCGTAGGRVAVLPKDGGHSRRSGVETTKCESRVVVLRIVGIRLYRSEGCDSRGYGFMESGAGGKGSEGIVERRTEERGR